MPAPHPHSCRGLKPGPWRFSRAAKHAAPGGACAGGSQRAGDAHVTASDSVSLRARGGREGGRRCAGPLRSRGPCEGQVAPGEVSEPAAHRPPSPRGKRRNPGGRRAADAGGRGPRWNTGGSLVTPHPLHLSHPLVEQSAGPWRGSRAGAGPGAEGAGGERPARDAPGGAARSSGLFLVTLLPTSLCRAEEHGSRRTGSAAALTCCRGTPTSGAVIPGVHAGSQ